MLYLIKCNNLIKIGYTTNLHRRIQVANKEFRFKDPKGMLCPYGCEGGDVFLEDIYLEKDLRE